MTHTSYAQLLRSSILRPRVSDKEVLGKKVEISASIEESVEFAKKGCKFSLRCPKVMDICTNQEPPVFLVDDRYVKCFLYSN